MATAPGRPPATRARRGGSRYRLSIRQFERMVEVGILDEHDPVVLIDGLLVTKMPRHEPHFFTTNQLQEMLRAIVPAGWHVRKEDPIALPDGPKNAPSMPEPDLMILRGSIADYRRRKPLPADVGLLVEVADSTLAKDRRLLRNYAWASIAAVWIVDLKGRRIDAYDNPTGLADAPEYRTTRTFGEADAIPVVLDGREVGRVAVRDLLP